jgi:hypothetical protein
MTHHVIHVSYSVFLNFFSCMNFTFQNDSSSAVALIRCSTISVRSLCLVLRKKITKWTQKVKHGEIDPISLWHTSHWCKKCSLAAPVQWLRLCLVSSQRRIKRCLVCILFTFFPAHRLYSPLALHRCDWQWNVGWLGEECADVCNCGVQVQQFGAREMIIHNKQALHWKRFHKIIVMLWIEQTIRNRVHSLVDRQLQLAT